MVHKITAEMRSQLGSGKGLACAIVYQDCQGIGNTVCGLLAPKINIFKADASYLTWKPSDELLKF